MLLRIITRERVTRSLQTQTLWSQLEYQAAPAWTAQSHSVP